MAVIERLFAVMELGKVGPSAAPAVPALKAATHDVDATVRRLARCALKAISTTP